MKVVQPRVGMCLTRHCAESYFRILQIKYVGRSYFKATIQMFRLRDNLALYGPEFDAKILLSKYVLMDRVLSKEVV